MYPNREQINRIKEEYPPGTEILLNRMGDDPNPIPSGSKGIVDHVDDIGTLHCHFPDINRSLGVVPGEDDFRKLTPAEKQNSVDEQKEDHPLLIGYGEVDYGKDLHSVKEVAEFIMKNGIHGDVMITDTMDMPFITTIGPYIDKAENQDYLQNKLLPVLIPMQEKLMGGEDDPEDFEEEYTNDQNISM